MNTIGYFEIQSSDPNRDSKFYQSVFDMHVMYHEKGFIQLTTPGCNDILVFEEKKDQPIGQTGGIAHFGFRLKNPNDIDGIIKNVIIAGGTIISSVGNGPNMFYGFRTNGVFTSDAEAAAAGLSKMQANGSLLAFKGGDVRFIDINGDKLIDNNDQQIIGDPNPEFYGSDKYKKENDGSYRAFEKHHYRINYRFTDNVIRVLRVRHTGREPKEY